MPLSTCDFGAHDYAIQMSSTVALAVGHLKGGDCETSAIASEYNGAHGSGHVSGKDIDEPCFDQVTPTASGVDYPIQLCTRLSSRV